MQEDYLKADPRKHQLESRGMGQGREESQYQHVSEQVTTVVNGVLCCWGPLEDGVENASKLSCLMDDETRVLIYHWLRHVLGC